MVMTRREALSALGLAVAGAPAVLRGRYRLFAQPVVEYSARAVRLVETSTVVDLLNQFQFPDFSVKPPKIEQWLTVPGSFTAADAARYRESGITVFALAHGAGDYQRAIRFYADWNGFLAAHSDWFTRIDDAADFARAKASGKVGVMLTFQDSTHFRTPDDVGTFFALGQRISQLAYNFNNRIGSGFLEQRDGGLSVFGLSILERMQQVGMAVDVSHCGDRTTLDAFEVSKRPVLITHSNCRALVPGHPRCKTDEAIRAMAKAGSVMGITGVRMFVKHDEPTTVEHMLDHYDHVRKLVGVEHLGLGSDMDLDGYDDMTADENKAMRAGYKDSYGFREKIDIEGVDHPKRVFDLTEGLIRRGYGDADIRGVLGGNFRRVIAQIWV